jgi:hypothetical protein
MLKRLLFVLMLVPSVILSQTPTSPKFTASIELSNTTRTINFRVSWITPVDIDSTMVAVFLSNAATPILFRKGVSPDIISFDIPDDTSTYRFSLYSVRRGLTSIPAEVNFFFNADEYYTLSRIHVRPREPTIDTSASIQLCAFLEFNDGTIVMRDRDLSKPKCVEEYQQWPPIIRKSIGARLRNANKVCLEWSVDPWQPVSREQDCVP